MKYCVKCGKPIEDSIISEGKNICKDCVIEFLKRTKINFEWTKKSEGNNA